MVLDTRPRLHAAANIDAERVNPANRFGNVVNA
jgi:hypothetical protein